MRAIYDFEYWQPSYCMNIFVMATEQERLKRGEDSIQVEFMPGAAGQFGKHKRWPASREENEQCFNGIVLPMLKMLPSVASVEMLPARTEYDDAFSLGHKFTNSPMLAAYAAGVRPLRWPGVERDPKLITITLRECGPRHWQGRDSDLGEWCQAASMLQAKGYRVAIVRDTRLADVPLPGLVTAPQASIDLGARAALYSAAACNLFVNNGPAWFATALDQPLLLFRPTCETAHKSATAAAMADYGMAQGVPLPGTPPHQRLVWNDDRADLIVEETLRFLAR